MTITLFFNGIILTLDEEDTETEAMAIYEDKILCVGSEKEVRENISHFISTQESEVNKKIDLEEVDLKGKLTVPGFIDTHMHPFLAIYFKTQLLVSNITSYADLSKVIQKAAQSKEAGEWIFCLDFMEDRLLDPKERRFPDKTVLDKMWSNNPVVLLRHDAHICTVNSLALEQIGITKSTVTEFQSESGKVKIFDNGEPSGIFTERATALALDFLPVPNLDNFKEACKDFSDGYASYGITTIGGILQTDEKGISG
ncbi:MAG: amidohydrolase family protein, partial [Promethearchaeota archaeon]